MASNETGLDEMFYWSVFKASLEKMMGDSELFLVTASRTYL